MKKKKYLLPEEKTHLLHEPTATYPTMVQANDAKNNTLKSPCQYSMEELKSGIPEFIEEFENDDLIPHEILKRKKI
ncbi:hypothetical protein M2459_001584 [Parabacteroides sp. PF5-5]|uniref:hypothetical protein n=1 Tax=unclassified Parabacteroides TaxID=2649774 RepID=UPI0024768F30|nr:MULTISPECIES: hypothetical protein [unclassified Parabacteroides]MDH6304846.1 hypothetical protein [Parabacteroides sp. PH5-39]MDH6316068.1 hypothetical protein [Parabacteroides sp. PF5-13]MDH6319725.1 hypothetical protein [Parabacteroides sp. PH5-13]MDH6323456.1 hypothetical protein [Parabacteroides sp. PH5-8]MDH6327036.1 hypothetical protein [Parabacteroides sp. PH5-41]